MKNKDITSEQELLNAIEWLNNRALIERIIESSKESIRKEEEKKNKDAHGIDGAKRLISEIERQQIIKENIKKIVDILTHSSITELLHSMDIPIETTGGENKKEEAE